MTNDELFLLTLSAQERNGLNFIKIVYGVSTQDAYKILKGEIEPPRAHEKTEPAHETTDPVRETAKANATPQDDSENHDPANRKEYQCKYCGRKFKLTIHSVSNDYCRFCIKEGLHYLHMKFGSTNGWDRKPKAPRNQIEPGWRGRVVVAPRIKPLNFRSC